MKNGMNSKNEKEFLDTMIAKQQKCKIITMNGYQMIAVINAHDDTSIIGKSIGHKDPFLMYKNAISTIMPYGH